MILFLIGAYLVGCFWVYFNASFLHDFTKGLNVRNIFKTTETIETNPWSRRPDGEELHKFKYSHSFVFEHVQSL